MDGVRVLVDRLWPRGVKKEDAYLDAWHKAIAPSNELRRWFHSQQDQERWDEFRQRYAAEIDANATGLDELLALAGDRPLTLIYAARDEVRNHAIVLRERLELRRGE
ncbi:DUF488 family protein [bacterium AH-315-K20]|nr:DUF488 family protein [bacterium AH-315-K20]